jgi:nucleoside-triphosphatase THEP1
MGEIHIITGGIGQGKTTLCRRLVAAATRQDWDVKGVLSLPVFEDGRKIGIDLVDVSSGEKRRLAHRDRQTSGPRTSGWHFLASALAWGDEILNRAVPCDLLVIDELGPLELLRNEGWQAGIGALNSGTYQIAVVVVRPSLLKEAFEIWPQAAVVEISVPEQAAGLVGEILP